MAYLDNALEAHISWQIKQFADEHFLGCDVIAYYGGIQFWSKDIYQPKLESIGRSASERGHETLVTLLYTTGGSVEAVEKMVEITRHFYKEVYFVVPDIAMSAGTIWCMSGDRIYMDYSSSLGPIDPQLQLPDGRWVPALGYLDKSEELIKKSAENKITNAELMMLNNLDLAQLRRFEQARDLSIDLLKKWLVQYKFRDWSVHQTNPSKQGKTVTKRQKTNRAQEIAKALSDNGRWHSHSRMIGINTLVKDLKLRIEDYTDNKDMSESVKNLHRVIMEYMSKANQQVLVLTLSLDP
ncbi:MULTISPECIES: SDH family Clp fold serine proteinase [Pectobacterium]|uniref:SDH family Clp fold serine proteinase n=1 Tax=Pectobacterium TaxID=122277 RepID=UPI00193EB37E|nr:serine dehydrogenasease [Pectobacterium brasiliense]QRN32601.1 serine dehydrogenasease [Pectobacterium brasiliense]